MSRANKNEPLSAAEQIVTNLVLQGMGNEYIATQLNIKEKTVRAHLVNIYKKLNVNSRLELAVDFYKNALTEKSELLEIYKSKYEELKELTLNTQTAKDYKSERALAAAAGLLPTGPAQSNFKSKGAT